MLWFIAEHGHKMWVALCQSAEYTQIYSWPAETRLGQARTFGTAEAAKKLGVSRQTLHRWFAVGRVKDVLRDHNNWRVFTSQDINRIRGEARWDGGGEGL
jgi:hypothetical protein